MLILDTIILSRKLFFLCLCFVFLNVSSLTSVTLGRKVFAFEHPYLLIGFGPLAVLEESYKMGSVLPSVLLSRRFLGIVSLVFSEFWHGARNPYEVVCDSRIFWKKVFCPQIWGNGPKMGQKQVF